MSDQENEQRKAFDMWWKEFRKEYMWGDAANEASHKDTAWHAWKAATRALVPQTAPVAESTP